MNKSLTNHIHSAKQYQTKAAFAAEQIHNSILEGVYRGGSRLLIPDICKDLNISAIPVREALHRLETTGFVEILSHRGVYVKELSFNEFVDCKETRLLLEKTAIEKAATKIKPDAIEFAKSLLDRYLVLLKSNMLLEAREVHKELHFTLYKAAQSNILM